MSTERPFLTRLCTDSAAPCRFVAQVGGGGPPLAQRARIVEELATEVLPVIRRETRGRSKDAA